MFYSDVQLRRGGKFYLCWVADSWPGRFKKISYRQLWSQDIRQICEDLMEVMTKESGQPSSRFSLRLSSQLMRGLVRLYQSKVSSFIGTLCMLNANVTKQINLKWHKQVERSPNGAAIQRVRRPKRPRITEVVPENEERVEERVQNSGNAVNNIEEITLREAVIPEIQVPVDGFGEDNPEQAIQLLNDRTIEQMLGADASAVQHSGLDLLPLNLTDKSQDKSRLAPHDVQMERISEHDISVLRKSDAAELNLEDIEKDIPIPEIPPPAIPIPSPEQVQVPPPQEPIQEPEVAPEAAKELVVPTELEELDDVEPVPKRRRIRKLIIDKRIKISGNVFRQRLDNIAVELRCEDSADDIIDARRLPWLTYFTRGARAAAAPLAALFQRQLGVVGPVPRDPEIELMLANPAAMKLRSSRRLRGMEEDRILEHARRHRPSPIPEQPEPVPEPVPETRPSIDVQLELAEVSIHDQPRASQAKKRSVEELEDFALTSAKKQRHDILPKAGYKSLKMSLTERPTEIQVPYEKEIEPPTDKVPEMQPQVPEIQPPYEMQPDIQEIQPVFEKDPEVEKDRGTKSDEEKQADKEKHLSQMLIEAGLADGNIQEEIRKPSQGKTRQLPSDESNETPLGSLDRTAVDVDSEKSTDTQKLLRRLYGSYGTMVRIVQLSRAGAAVSLRALLGPPARPAQPPPPPPPRRLAAAWCFTSLLKLKQHGFVKLEKDPVTMEITNITLGPKVPNFN